MPQSKTESFVLAANAQPGIGGQGINFSQFVEALNDRFKLTTFGRARYEGVDGFAVPESRYARLMDRIPLVRGLENHRQHFSDRNFDCSVAGRLPRTEVFQGVTGQCLQSLRQARKMGAFTILDCITTHVDDFFEKKREESRRLGVRPAISDTAREMAVAEYDTAERIRAMSSYAKQTMVERGVPERRVFVARPPLAASVFPVADFRSPRFRVSYVGLLAPAKGFRYLIEAFRAFPEADAELALWTAPGNRIINRYMQQQIAADARIWMRPLSVRENYGEVYGKSHVLVHPSLADGYSYAVMEAMASGVPVIVTSCTGSAELIRDGESGYVIPPADTEAIRERLIHLSRNPEVLRKMGAAARETLLRETPAAFRESYCSRLGSLTAAQDLACST